MKHVHVGTELTANRRRATPHLQLLIDKYSIGPQLKRNENCDRKLVFIKSSNIR